jgi:DNA-binding LacI/PurR family transcriptional regulator
MQEEAEAVGARLRIGNAENLDKILSAAGDNNTAGIIYMPDINHPHDLDWPQLEVPHVLFSLGEKSVDANYVTPNNYRGGYLAAQALHKTVNSMAYVLWEQPSNDVFAFKPYHDRLSGFIDYCHINNLKEPERLMLKDVELEGRIREFLSLSPACRPGLMLIDDMVLNALEKSFLSLFPDKKLHEEFEMVFFQDFNFKPELPCATISFSRRAFCREVIDLLQRVSAHPEHQPISVKIPMYLTPRAAAAKKIK